MEEIDKIIEVFGGTTNLANALGHKHPTTVHGWKRRGKIPHFQIENVFAAAERIGVQLPEKTRFELDEATHDTG